MLKLIQRKHLKCCMCMRTMWTYVNINGRPMVFRTTYTTFHYGNLFNSNNIKKLSYTHNDTQSQYQYYWHEWVRLVHRINTFQQISNWIYFTSFALLCFRFIFVVVILLTILLLFSLDVHCVYDLGGVAERCKARYFFVWVCVECNNNNKENGKLICNKSKIYNVSCWSVGDRSPSCCRWFCVCGSQM